MTQRFVLDENILILAEKGENDRGESDPTCLDIYTQIITICHTLVVDPALWGKYQSQLSPSGNIGFREGYRILAVLDSASRVPGKLEFRPGASAFPEEESIPQGSQDDVPIVRLVVETGSALVTTDEALREGLNSCGVQERYNLQLLAPDQVLARL